MGEGTVLNSWQERRRRTVASVKTSFINQLAGRGTSSSSRRHCCWGGGHLQFTAWLGFKQGVYQDSQQISASLHKCVIHPHRRDVPDHWLVDVITVTGRNRSGAVLRLALPSFLRKGPYCDNERERIAERQKMLIQMLIDT